MLDTSIDILMITFNRPEYTRLSLPRLLSQCDEWMRVWLWHNGSDKETLRIVREYSAHPRLHGFHHSLNNAGQSAPLMWLFSNAEGELLGKVDDDVLLPDGWAESLRQAHADEPRFGAICCSPFLEEDFNLPRLKTRANVFAGGHRLVRTRWVWGGGVIMKRQCAELYKLLRKPGLFSDYSIQLTLRGWVNGFYYPLIYADHMDDPRSVNSGIRTDKDLIDRMPVTAANQNINTVEGWQMYIQALTKKITDSPEISDRFLLLRRCRWRVRRWLRQRGLI